MTYSTRRREASPILLIEVVDVHGVVVINDPTEPEPGSIILIHGEHGTAWQRQFKDGKWMRVGGGRPRDWAWVLGQRRVYLTYDAPARRFDDEGNPLVNPFHLNGTTPSTH